MLKLKDIDATAQYALAQKTPARVYEDDPIQAPHIKLAREMVARELEGMRTEIGHQRRQIIELGCGTADISGWFSMGHDVFGFEASPDAAISAGRRWPWMKIHVGDLQPDFDTAGHPPVPTTCDILILCEILEHLPDPMALCTRWMPHAKACLISCPINGDLNGDLSGGEHVHSISPADWEEFFRVGGHEVVERKSLTMGSYEISLGLSRRKDEP